MCCLLRGKKVPLMTTDELVNQIKATHNVLSDEAVSFVGGAPGNLHLAILAVITGQLQVPGWVGHCGTHIRQRE